LTWVSRAAFILRWWPAIIEKIKVSQRGDRWRLPLQWGSIDHLQMQALKDPRIDTPKSEEGETPTTNAKQQNFGLDPK